MPLRSKWLFILLGNDKTGKTTLQKKIIKLLSSDDRDIRLDCNQVFDITNPYLIRKLRTFSIGNRSIQEKLDDYKSVPEYFATHLAKADLCIISSHLKHADVQQMIAQGHRYYYNVCGIFLTNSISVDPDANAQISELLWDERWLASNDSTVEETEQDAQLQSIAEMFVQMLIQRTPLW
jgi:hypothetical protein